MFGRMQGFLATMAEIRGCYVGGVPAAWRRGQSSMHVSRRFGLLIDPSEAWESLARPAGAWTTSLIILATDPVGMPVAFALHAGKGFLMVVPADFDDNTVRSLVAVAEARLGVGRPGTVVPDGGGGNVGMDTGGGSPPAAASAPGVAHVESGPIPGPTHPPSPALPPPRGCSPSGEFMVEVERGRSIVRDTRTNTVLGKLEHTGSGLCDRRNPERPRHAARLLCCLCEYPSAGVSRANWNASKYHPVGSDGHGGAGDTDADAFRRAVSALRQALAQVLAGSDVQTPAGARFGSKDIISFSPPHRLLLKVRILDEFRDWVAAQGAPAGSCSQGT